MYALTNTGAVEALLSLGWARDEEEEALFVPKGRYFSMNEVIISFSKMPPGSSLKLQHK